MKDNLYMKSIFKTVVVRILFYVLFLIGPFILTESHVIHVRMQRECSLAANDSLRTEVRKKYKSWICALDIIGASCSCLWVVWLLCAIGFKIVKQGK
jgi:hypothetical protein